jgi:hypothetical protein
LFNTTLQTHSTTTTASADPQLYLTPQEIARVLIVRSKLGDTCAERATERIDRDPFDDALPW